MPRTLLAPHSNVDEKDMNKGDTFSPAGEKGMTSRLLLFVVVGCSYTHPARSAGAWAKKESRSKPGRYYWVHKLTGEKRWQ